MFCKSSAHGAFESLYTKCPNIEVPSSSTLTYEGLFSENYFKIKEKEIKAFYNFEISNASILNPLTKKREYYLGVLLKSKYDGIGLREPIDIGLSVDISGSMCCENRLEYTKESIFKFFENLTENDNICINVFNNEDKLILPFQKKNNLIDLESLAKSVEAGGGTDIYKGLNGIYNELNKYYDKGNKNKRIILITDMEYEHNEEFISLCHKISKEKIYLTILGISDQFNTELVEEIAHIEGSNYYVITKMEDIEKYLVKEFNYVCFPSSFNNILEINAPFLSINSVIGTGKKKINKDDVKLEWNQSSHKLYNKNFRDGIFYMLCYFKKKGKILPKPIILCISKYIQTSHIKSISEMDTLFPSNIKELENNMYVKGGIFLLRLNEQTLHKKNYVQINMKYKSAIDYKNYEISSLFDFDKVEKDEFFSDKNIEKALGLYYFAKFNRILMKYCNNENKNVNNKYIQDIIKNNKIGDMKNIIKKFFYFHFRDLNNNDNYIKYMINMEKITIKTENYLDFNYDIIEYFSLSTLELIKAGDYLISKYPEWKWQNDEKNLVNDKIPKDKAYLKATFYCSQRVRDYINSFSNLNIGEDEKGNDEKDKNKIKNKKSENKMRKYDVFITYSLPYDCPRVWFMGYDCNNNPLNFDEIKEDIMPDKRNKVCNIEVQPFNGIKCMSINPAGYRFLFEKVLENLKEKVFIILLNFIHSIIPTIIINDFGQDIILNL